MPNYTWNTINADADVIKRCLNDKGEFSFNNFIPMPWELKHTTAGGIVNDLVCLYLLEKYPFAEIKRNRKLLEGFRNNNIEMNKTKKYNIEKLKKWLNGKTVDEIRDGWEDNAKVIATLTGEDYFNLQQKYGYHNWYDWCNANWNTKWDAFDVNVYDDEINFTTAWSAPEPIFRKICETFPERQIKFEAEYEDNFLYVGSNHAGVFFIDDEFERNYPDDFDWNSDEEPPWTSLRTNKEYVA